MSSLHIREHGEGRAEAARIRIGCPFFYLAKYEGERGPRSIPTGDQAADQLKALQEDLADPACVEIVVGGDDIPTKVWRK
jgi:hypothetical protein